MKFTNWLMKTEPDVYSIDDLKQQGVTPWEGSGIIKLETL